jgi:hypothetical protein
MREGFKKSHINVASCIMSFFMQAIWARAAHFAKATPRFETGRGSYHGNGILPKGFKNHNPAGSKIAKLAENHMCTKKC